MRSIRRAFSGLRSSWNEAPVMTWDTDGYCERLLLTNSSSLPVKIHFHDMCVATIPARSKLEKKLPPRQIKLSASWKASVCIHGDCHFSLAGGKLGRANGSAATVNVTGDCIKLNEKLLGMSVKLYARLVRVQLAWRRHLRACAAARALRKKKAATHVQRAFRKHLHASTRTCFICFSDVTWKEMVTLVPTKRCHKMCPSCAKQHINVALKEGKMHIRCPGEGCKHLLEEREIRKLASSEALKQRSANIQAANARRIADLAKEDASFLSFCAEHTRKCPSCHVLIYRHAGCDHMTCKCGAEFDWTKDASAKIGSDGRVGGRVGGRARRSGRSGDSLEAELNAWEAADDAAAIDGDVATYQTRRPAPLMRVPRPQTRAEEEAQLAAAIAASAEIASREQ